MSRVGRKPITVPLGVVVTIDNGEVTVKGPKGELHQRFSPDMLINLEDNTLKVSRPSDSKRHRAMHGLTRALLANRVEGASNGFEKGLEIVGVGYRVEKSEEQIVLRVGYSHAVRIKPMPGVSLTVEGINRIRVSGINKEIVGEMAARIRAVRPPDKYKGKGIKYAGEKIQLKAGKAAKAIGKRK